MLEKILEIINKFFNKQQTIQPVQQPVTTNTVANKIAIKNRIISEMDFNQYGEPEIINSETDKVMLIVDDIVESAVLYNIDFNRILRVNKKDIKSEYNMVLCIGELAGFRAFKYLLNGGRVDFAILDLTLGHTVRLPNGDYLEIDGVDIASLILNNNPEARLVISTVHTMNKSNPSISHYFNEFTERTGKDLIDYYFNKNGDRAKDLYNVLYNKS